MSYGHTLHEKGYRLTPQRLMVLEALHSVDTHISVEEIYTQVKKKYRYANISTVYRTLELLKELGLVTEIDIGDGRVRYHPSEKGHHHHLICNICGTVIDFPETVLLPVQRQIERDYKFNADLQHLAIFGKCDKCKK